MVLVLAGLLVVMEALRAAEVTPLLAWTGPIIEADRNPLLFAAYLATWFVARRLRGEARRTALLLGSAAAAAVFDVGFLVASLVWIAGLHGLLARPRLALVYVLATYVLAFLYPPWGYVFAVSYTFRIAWLLHQVRLHKEPIALADVTLYFVFAPFFVIVPYMLAIPRFDTFRRGIAAHDLAIERSGVRMIAWGIGLALAAWGVRMLYGPSELGLARLAEGAYGVAFVHGFFAYMLEDLLGVLAIAAILVGMVRVLGFDLGPSFDAPLRSESVNEWWRRWNTHFRDLLVELFYTPIVLRLRRRRTLAVVAGTSAVFLVGSTLFHIPKHVFAHGLTLPVGVFAESLVMAPLVAVALVRKREAPARGVAHRALRIVFTLVVVYVAVVIVGRGVQRAVLGGT